MRRSWRLVPGLPALLGQVVRRDLRSFARLRELPVKQRQKSLTREEYRQAILENARRRREALLLQNTQAQTAESEAEKAVAPGTDVTAEKADVESDVTAEKADFVESDVTAEKADFVESDVTAEKADFVESNVTAEEITEETGEEAVGEKELFLQLLQDREKPPVERTRRYVPFVPSEDDDEYSKEPPPPQTFVAQIFAQMEQQSLLHEQAERSVYPEEEVTVKLVHFDVEEEQEPVQLQLERPRTEPERVLYLRQIAEVESTRSKLFPRTEATHEWRELSAEEFELGPEVEIDLIQSVQRMVDWAMQSGEEVFGKKLFHQIRVSPKPSLDHLQALRALLPPSMDLLQIAQRLPQLLLLENKTAFNLGAECAGALYPTLKYFRKAFRLGLCHVEILEDVLQIGHLLAPVQSRLPAMAQASQVLAFRDRLEEVSGIVPNFAKVVESSGGRVRPDVIAAVVRDPQLTKRRIEACRKKIHNWQDFNLYAHADFTLCQDDLKFQHFCEMYNMTRPLQKDFAEHPGEGEQGAIPDFLYFWKQDWMRNEDHQKRKLPNGVLPHQYTSFYAAYEVLALEGLSWRAFVRGLTILSKQKEVGVYEELHFYERLRQSRQRLTLSNPLRNGLADVLRMMCRRGQISMELEPQTKFTPIFEVTPIHKESEIFA